MNYQVRSNYIKIKNTLDGAFQKGNNKKFEYKTLSIQVFHKTR
jgi:hypothetical protein